VIDLKFQTDQRVILDFKKNLEVQKKYWGCRKKTPNLWVKILKF